MLSILPLLATLSNSRTNLPWPLIATAMIGGTLLALGNISFQWATHYGLPLTTTLALQASLTVLLGTSLNYVLEPQQTPYPEWLVTGVCTFLIAIGLAWRLQWLYGAHSMAVPTQSSSNTPTYSAVLELPYGALQRKESDAVTVVDSEDSTSISPPRNNRRGLLIAVAGGLCFGFFSPAFNVAVNDPLGWTKVATGEKAQSDIDAGARVFLVNVWFSLAFGAASVVANLLLLREEAGPSHATLRQMLHHYATQATWNDRRVALTAGAVCAAGNVLQFHGGQLVGYATSDLVQAYPLVSTLWDFWWFDEFSNVRWCCSRLALLLVSMYTAYLGGIVLLAVSSMEF